MIVVVVSARYIERIDVVATMLNDDFETIVHDWVFDHQDGELVRHRKPTPMNSRWR